MTIFAHPIQTTLRAIRNHPIPTAGALVATAFLASTIAAAILGSGVLLPLALGAGFLVSSTFSGLMIWKEIQITRLTQLNFDAGLNTAVAEVKAAVMASTVQQIAADTSLVHADLQMDVSGLQQQLQSRVLEIEDLKQNLQTSREDLEAAREKHRVITIQYQQQITALEAQITQLTQKMSGLAAQLRTSQQKS